MTRVDPVTLLSDAGDYFISRLALVPDGGWDAPTPCPGWTVRVVAAHVVNGFPMIRSLLAQQPWDPADRNRDILGDDPVSTARTELALAIAALREPGALDVVVAAPPGPLPASAFAAIRAVDTVVHGWDLATGAGVDPAIPDRLAQAVLAATPSQTLEAGRRAGVFGPAVQIGPDADHRTRLLALFGRQP